MLQARIHGPGDVRVDDVPEPVLGPRDVIVRVAACSSSCGRAQTPRSPLYRFSIR